MKKPFVLHIATNLDGGPGRVHLSTLKFAKNTTASFAHEFLILDEKHVTSDSLKLFSEYSDCLHIGKNEAFIREKMNNADIIQIDWWNHPLIYNLLINFTFPDRVCHFSRSWAHNDMDIGNCQNTAPTFQQRTQLVTIMLKFVQMCFVCCVACSILWWAIHPLSLSRLWQWLPGVAKFKYAPMGFTGEGGRTDGRTC